MAGIVSCDYIGNIMRFGQKRQIMEWMLKLGGEKMALSLDKWQDAHVMMQNHHRV